MKKIRTILISFALPIIANLFGVSASAQNEQAASSFWGTPVNTLKCRFRTEHTGQLVVLDGVNPNNTRRTYSTAGNQYFWSCPDAMEPLSYLSCPHPTNDTRWIYSSLYFIIDNSNDSSNSTESTRAKFENDALQACDKAKELYKNQNRNGPDLFFIEYGIGSNEDFTSTIFHRPLFTKIPDPKPNGLPFTRMVLFGDSISDNGNMYSTFAFNPFYGVVPWPYFAGRFSNGLLWGEVVAKKIAATEGLSFDLLDYAEGGAASVSIGSNPYALHTQVNNYLAMIHETPMPGVQWDPGFNKTIFAVFMGSNDYLDFVEGNNFTDLYRQRYCIQSPRIQNPAEGCAKAVVNGNPNITGAHGIKGEIEEIIKEAKKYNQNAKYFLVPTQTNLASIPEYARGDKSASAVQFMNDVTKFHNQFLKKAMKQLEKKYKVTILTPDVSTLIDTIIANPENPIRVAAGIKDVKNSCFPVDCAGNFTDDFIRGNMCPVPPNNPEDPESHLFWDTAHPTMTTHCVIGEFVLEDMYRKFGLSYAPKYSECHNSYTHKPY